MTLTVSSPITFGRLIIDTSAQDDLKLSDFSQKEQELITNYKAFKEERSDIRLHYNRTLLHSRSIITEEHDILVQKEGDQFIVRTVPKTENTGDSIPSPHWSWGKIMATKAAGPITAVKALFIDSPRVFAVNESEPHLLIDKDSDDQLVFEYLIPNENAGYGSYTTISSNDARNQGDNSFFKKWMETERFKNLFGKTNSSG